MQLYEKHRPRTWGEFIGNARAVKRIRTVVERKGFGEGSGDAFLIAGPSGTGKTTLAKIAAGTVGASAYNVRELDGADCTIEAVRELQRGWIYHAMGNNPWRVVIVNEYHAMSSKAVQAWLTLLERLPAHTLIVFTTTEDTADLFGDFASPFRSRCKHFQLTSQGLADGFARRAREIAQAEGLDGKPERVYKRYVSDRQNNMRSVLNGIEAGEMLD